LAEIDGPERKSSRPHGIEEFRRQAREMGLTISTETAVQAGLLGDAFDAVWWVLKQTAFTIGGAPAPTLSDLAKRTRVGWASRPSTVAEWIKQNQTVINTALRVAAGVAVAGAALVVVGTAVSAVGTALGGLATIVTGVGTAFGVIGSAIAALVVANHSRGFSRVRYSAAHSFASPGSRSRTSVPTSTSSTYPMCSMSTMRHR
jgi:hypothetical protein